MSTLEPARPIDLGSSYAEDPRDASATLQSYGILAVVSLDALTIEAISDNTERLLGVPPTRLLGAALTDIIHAEDALAFCATLRAPRLAALNPHELSLAGADGPLPVECTAARSVSVGSS